MAKLKELLDYKNPWLINWLKSPDKFFTLFVAWIIYAFVGRLFGLNDNNPEVYKFISRLMFWPSVLFGGWKSAKPALYQYLYSEKILGPQPSKAVAIKEKLKEKNMEKNEQKSSAYIQNTLNRKAPTSKKDIIYGIITAVLVFIFLYRYSWISIFIFLVDFNIVSFVMAQIGAYLITLILSTLAGIIVTYYLSTRRYHHSPEAQIKEEEIKETVPQSHKSGHPYLKAIIYFIAFSFLISAFAAYINREPTKENFAEFELMGQDGVEKTFYTKSTANVRSCASTSCATISQIGQNSTVKIYYDSLEEAPEWIEISFTRKNTGEKVIGYINKIVLSETQTAQTPSISGETAPTQKITVTQKPTITAAQEPTTTAQSAGNPANLQGTWKLAQIAIPDQATGEYDIRNAPVNAETYNVIQGNQSCGYVFENNLKKSGPNCSLFTADGYTFTDDSGPVGWAIINGALIFTMTDSGVSASVGVPLGTKFRFVSSTIPAETAQQSLLPQPPTVPASGQQTIVFGSARCSVAPGYAWPPKSSGSGGIFLGIPINAELDITVSGPIDSILNLTGSGFPKTPRLWSDKTSCQTAGSSCSVYQRISGNPSEWKMILPKPSITSIKSPENFPVSSNPITIRLGYHDPKYTATDIMIQDSLITKNAKIEITSCQPTDGSSISSCECRVIEQ